MGSSLKKHLKSGYKMIRSVFLRIEPFKTGDLTDKTQVEAAIQAIIDLHSLIKTSHQTIIRKTRAMSHT